MSFPLHLFPGRMNVGVVVVHDITGLDKTDLSFAEKLAQEGFHVAAVDLFQGRLPKDIPEAIAMRATVTPQMQQAALRAGLDALRAKLGAGAKIGSMGFCFGGGAALEGACHAPFDFCVDYYGMSANVDDVKALRGPLRLILASEDDRINPWAYGQLMPKLDEHRKRVRVELYPAVAHPFHRPDWITSPFPGAAKSYDEAAASDAWKRAVAFIHEAAVGA